MVKSLKPRIMLTFNIKNRKEYKVKPDVEGIMLGFMQWFNEQDLSLPENFRIIGNSDTLSCTIEYIIRECRIGYRDEIARYCTGRTWEWSQDYVKCTVTPSLTGVNYA